MLTKRLEIKTAVVTLSGATRLWNNVLSVLTLSLKGPEKTPLIKLNVKKS